MTAYDRVLRARAKGRATALDYITQCFNDFTQMHGDRAFADDKAVVAGIGFFEQTPVTIIGIEKGHGLKERTARNFGMPHPEGYRKAHRQMKLAEKFGRPVICLIDTPGAFCGISAEERGQGQAIAQNLMLMSSLRVPILSIILGEGGSGGALALAVADRVLMLENAVYSVISPEGCASILWKDASRVADASSALKLTAKDLLCLGVIDGIIKEHGEAMENVRREIAAFLRTHANFAECTDSLIARRYARFRRLGVYGEDESGGAVQ